MGKGCKSVRSFIAVLLTAVMANTALAAEVRAPAGQMCPAGSYVIGFDAGANIICSGICGNGILDPVEECDDGNTNGSDGCSPACRVERAEVPAAAAGAVAGPATRTAQPSPDPAVATPASAGSASAATAVVSPYAVPVVADIEPSEAVFGSRAVTLTISGSGFTASTVIRFGGSDHVPTVNEDGTRLVVTLPVRTLPIGPYPITVSNGPGRETTLRKALEIF